MERVSHGLSSKPISLTIRALCGLQQEEARAECAAVARV